MYKLDIVHSVHSVASVISTLLATSDATVMRIVKTSTNECKLNIKWLKLILKQIPSNYFNDTEKPHNLH